MTKILYQKFKELTSRIIEEINKRNKKCNYFRIEQYEVFVPDLRGMHYKDGKVEYFLETSKKQRYHIDFEVKVPEFYNEFCISLLEFRELTKLLEETYQIQRTQAEQIIQNFFYYLISKTNGEPENKNLDKFIDKFIKSITQKTPYVKTKIFLDGIWLKEEEFHINPNLKIRRIKASDFETHSPEVLKQQFQAFGNFPYVVLKYNIPLDFEIKNSQHLQTEILKRIRLVIYAFLLFRFGSVFSRKCLMPIFQPSSSEIIFQAVTGFGYNMCEVEFTKGKITHLNPRIFISTRHTYSITKKDLENLNRIINLFKRVDIEEILFPGPKKSNYITIALNRYQNAFLNVENLESQISYGVSCLEALFSENPGELQRKLKQRMSKIFSIFEFNSLVVNNIVRTAYRVRSNYSHGVIEKSEYKELEKLAYGILQCARISLLLFLQIDKELQKKKNLQFLKIEVNTIKEQQLKKERKKHFLAVIDNALIHEKSHQRLNEFIKKRIFIY